MDRREVQETGKRALPFERRGGRWEGRFCVKVHGGEQRGYGLRRGRTEGWVLSPEADEFIDHDYGMKPPQNPEGQGLASGSVYAWRFGESGRLGTTCFPVRPFAGVSFIFHPGWIFQDELAPSMAFSAYPWHSHAPFLS